MGRVKFLHSTTPFKNREFKRNTIENNLAFFMYNNLVNNIKFSKEVIMAYKIITDTTAGLTTEIVKKYNIKIIPLSYINDGEVFSPKGNEDESYLKNFYTLMRNNANLSTSCVNTEVFEEEFKEILDSGLDLLYLGFSSGLSVTYSCAQKAKENLQPLYPDRKILCLDTLLASMGQGLLVYNACKLKEEGKTIEEVYDFCEKQKQNLNSIFTVSTLTYLAKGGRVSKVSATIGNLVDIKPLMYVSDKGKLLAYNKVMGRKRSIFAIADRVCKTIVNPEEQEVFISHGDSEEEAKLLAKLISDKINVKGFVFNYIDPVIGTHSGPGTLAVFYFGLKREETISSFK